MYLDFFHILYMVNGRIERRYSGTLSTIIYCNEFASSKLLNQIVDFHGIQTNMHLYVIKNKDRLTFFSSEPIFIVRL